MALDAAKNWAKANLSTGYATGDTSVVLVSGGGAKFPAAPFNAVWYNSTDYSNPGDDASAEIVRVTVISTDTLTITRAQESTSAANHNTAGKTYTLFAGPTAKLLTDILGISITGSAATVTGAAQTAITSVGTLSGLTVTAAPTFSALTLGSVRFASTSGLIAQDNANFFWDATNHRLGIGTTAPGYPLTVLGTAVNTVVVNTPGGLGGPAMSLIASSAGTGRMLMSIQSTGAYTYLGSEASGGGTFTNSLAYASIFE